NRSQKSRQRTEICHFSFSFYPLSSVVSYRAPMGHGNSWVLAGGRVARNAMRADLLDIEIRAGRIAGLRRPGERIRSVPRVDVRGCVILPGLINAHDHLEFNLFPRLGRGPYPD